MTIFQRVLIIGSPLSYELVDDELIERNFIKAFYLYKKTKNQKLLHSKLKVFVDELTIHQVKQIIMEYKIDSIVCFDDQFLLEAAKIRKELHLPGIVFDVMKKFKCKSEMNKQLKEHIKTIPSLYTTKF